MMCWRVYTPLLAVGSVLLMVSGCTTTASPANPVSAAAVQVRERQLAELQGWQVQGRLGAWSDETSMSAGMLWQDQPGGFDLRLVAPLGLGTLNVRQRLSKASVSRGNRLLASGPDAAVLLQQVLGLPALLPLQALRDWVRGLPGERAEDVRRDAEGRLAEWRFRDSAGTRWQARIKRYGRFEALPVPQLITAAGGSFHLRIVLEDWVRARQPPEPGRLNIPGRKRARSDASDPWRRATHAHPAVSVYPSGT